MKVQEILISKIRQKQNIRTRTDDLAQLMESIKQHDLLHPIGVQKEGAHFDLAYGARRLEACKRLGWKKISAVIIPGKLTTSQFLSINTIENIHRKKITASELARICGLLRKEGLTAGEIAVKLSLFKSRVESLLNIYNLIPKDFLKYIGFQEGKNKRGKIPPDIASRILSMRVPIEIIHKVLEIAKRKELSGIQIDLIQKFILSGSTLKEAVRLLDQYVIKHLYLVVDKTELKKINSPFSRYVARIVKKHNDALVYLEEDR